MEVSANAIKSAYILKFISYISWENEQSFSEFRIAIVDSDEQFYEEFKKEADIYRPKDKRIFIEIITEFRKLPEFHIVYVTQNSISLLDEIANITRRTNTLVISDSSDKKNDFMINLVLTKEGNITFEINKSNLVYENLKLHKDILLLGGTELDVAELVRETEQALQAVKEEAQLRELELAKLETVLKGQQQQLEKQTGLIRVQEQKLQRQEKQFAAKEQEFSVSVANSFSVA